MKKKFFYGIITVVSMLFILVLCQNKVNAATVYNDKISYEIEWNGTVTIQAAGKYITSINSGDIPTTIEGKPVTKIAYGGFKNCTYLESVVLPSSITEIDKYAFANCSSLKTINIPNGVKQISYATFSGCSSLKSITLKNVTKIEWEAFDGCSSLSSVSLPNTLKEIQDTAFRGSTSLRNITLPSSLTNLGDTVFYRFGTYNNYNTFKCSRDAK